jgi:branched-chain amino acid transport system permease protein
MNIPTVTISCGITKIDLVSVLIEVGIFFCLYLIVSLTVNLEFGYAGVPNFGKVLFVSAGGLIAGSLSYRLAIYVLNLRSSDIIGAQALFASKISNAIISNPYFGVELFLFSLAVGSVVAATVGYVASFPAIRLREDYLGMLLLAAGQFFLIFVTAYYPITGGTEGLLIPDPLSWTLNVSILGLRNVVVLAVLIVAAVGVFLYSEKVARSPLGRMMRAIRDNEISSDAIGKDTIGVRRNVLIIASAISGIVGVLYIFWLAAIAPTTFTRTVWTFYPFVIVILGGAANNIGVGLGSAVFVGITTTLDQARTCILTNSIRLPVDINALEPIAIGALLLIVLLWRPKGLLREKSTPTIKKPRLQAILAETTRTLKQENAPLPPQSTETDDETVPPQSASLLEQDGGPPKQIDEGG